METLLFGYNVTYTSFVVEKTTQGIKIKVNQDIRKNLRPYRKIEVLIIHK